MSSNNLISIVRERVGHCIDLSVSGKSITFLNPYSFFIARRYVHLFEEFDVIYIDGGLLSRILSIAFGRKIERVSFDMTSMASEIFEKGGRTGETIYFLGARDSEVKSAVEKIKKKYPGLVVVGYSSGYFSEDDKDKVISSIIGKNPDLFVAGMGVVKQEEIILELRKKGYRGAAFTCGGFIHQTALSDEDLVYYPAFINRAGLRWLYRLYDEPKLIVRYLFYYPVALSAILFDLLREESNNKE